MCLPDSGLFDRLEEMCRDTLINRVRERLKTYDPKVERYRLDESIYHKPQTSLYTVLIRSPLVDAIIGQAVLDTRKMEIVTMPSDLELSRAISEAFHSEQGVK